MRPKLLTVDDSRTVRIIIRNTLKAYDLEIFEATNGVEGLAMAAKAVPDLILLDITMPVMDGVEMLYKLKADPALKGIPVIMLTAEGGKDNVLKIVKIGVCDYIVKPFKADILLQKIGHIVDLKAVTDAPVKIKTIFEPASILVVEDKPIIITQIQEGLKHTPWQVQSVASPGEAIDHCANKPVDLILVSLALPDEAAYALFRMLRAGLKNRATPIMALVVKTDTVAQQHAQQVGFNGICTKPLDLAELESRIAAAMHLDTSQRHFRNEPDLLVLQLPDKCTPALATEIAEHLRTKAADAVTSGIGRAVFDLRQVADLDVSHIKLLLAAIQICGNLSLQFALLGAGAVVHDSRKYEDTHGWQFFTTLEEARASFAKPASPTLEPAGASAR